MRKILCVAVLTSLAASLLFALLSWPLPRFMTSGIPASAHNIEQPAWRYGIHGDHLQYLYRFDLMSDMLAGRIDWFHNPYEFNTGNDADRYRPGAYFLPLSGLYALLKPFIGQALAWNLLLWLTVWLSALCTWGWLQRFTQDRAAWVTGIGFALLVPFRWTALFGGSPSGHVLMWLPLLAWGIDVAIREASWSSGAWVGLAVLMCFFGDLHVFYFAVLAIPVFVLISLFGHRDMNIPWKQWYRVLPLGLLSAALVGAYYLWRLQFLTGSVMSDGRQWHELRLYSPSLRGLWTSRAGIDGTFYLGWFALLALAMAALHVAWKWGYHRHRDARRLILFAGGLMVFAATVLLALGANGPRDGWVIRVARALIPEYGMIRQPTKIFALMPMWLAWLIAIGVAGRDGEQPRWRTARHICMAILLLGSAAEIIRAVNVTVCLIEPDQPAYAAVARDARARSAAPGRVLVVPLWPGDSADTSLPVHWGQRYGLRMLNGYSAAAPQKYVENQFRRFQSVNQGLLTDEQLAALLQMGIHYLVVHENMFPEKVSPFPIQTTLARLTANPHIHPLQQAGPVHAFRINKLRHRIAPETFSSQCRSPFPSRRWFLVREQSENGTSIDDPQTVSGQALRLSGNDSGRLRIPPTRLAPRPDLKWWVRAKGKGRIRAATRWSDTLSPAREIQVDIPEWGWIQIPIDRGTHYQQVALELDVLEGKLDLDIVLLGDGNWPEHWDPGTTHALPAVCFFHAGHVDADGTSVVFRSTHEPADIIFYGPGLPLPAGHYRIEPVISSEAKRDQGPLAEFRVRTRGGEASPWTQVHPNAPAAMDWQCPDNRPFVFELKYTRQADIRIHEIRITRLPQEHW